MALRATSLGPKSLICFLFVCFVFCCIFFSLCFLCFSLKNCFPPPPPQKKRRLFLFECLPLFLLSLFWPPTFQFLLLSLSLGIFFISSSLSLCWVSFGFCLFLSLSFFFAFVSWREQHQNTQLQSFFSSILSLFGFPVLFSLSDPFFLSLFFFPDFKLCFYSTSMFWGFNTNIEEKQKKTHTSFWSEGSCNKTGYFYEPVFCKLCKVIFFFALSWQFWLMFKKHYNNRYFNTFLKAKHWKKTIFKRHYLVQGRVIIWSKLGKRRPEN